jgi:hypothetical protein
MAAAAHIFPNAVQRVVSKNENWSSGGDTLKVGLATGVFNWVAATEAYTFVSDFLTNSGSGGGGALTEVSSSSTGYSRQSLSSVALSTTGLVTTVTCATISWTATASWSAQYAFFWDDTDGSPATDAARHLICYWDFGGSVSVVSGGNFTLTINASGLVTFTSS